MSLLEPSWPAAQNKHSPATLSFHQLATCSDALGLLCRTRQPTETFRLASYVALTQPGRGTLTPNTSQVLGLIVKALRSDDITRPNWNVPVSCGRVATEHGPGQSVPCALGRGRHEAGLEGALQPRAGPWARGDVLARRAVPGGLLKASLLCMWGSWSYRKTRPPGAKEGRGVQTVK